MSKILIDFELSENPHHYDLIVWDENKKRYVQISKYDFFTEIKKEIDEVKKDVEFLKEQNKQANENIKILADILKGEIE